MEEGVPVFNLKSAFPYLIDGSFPTPCRQCVVMENGTLSTCGRCAPAARPDGRSAGRADEDDAVDDVSHAIDVLLHVQ